MTRGCSGERLLGGVAGLAGRGFQGGGARPVAGLVRHTTAGAAAFDCEQHALRGVGRRSDSELGLFREWQDVRPDSDRAKAVIYRIFGLTAGDSVHRFGAI